MTHVLRGLDQPARHHGPAPASLRLQPDPLQRIVLDMVARVAGELGKEAPTFDPQLTQAAHVAIDGVTRGRASREVLEFARSEAGFAQPITESWTMPVPYEYFVRGDPKELERVLRRVLEKTTYSHYGVGIRTQLGVTVVVMFLAQDRLIELRPFPRRAEPGERLVLSGALAPTHHDAKVIVTGNDGEARDVELTSRSDQAFEAPILCPGEEAQLQVEVMGSYEGDPQVLANFPLWCGRDPPRELVVNKADRKSEVTTAEAERSLFDLINAERGKAGLGALTQDEGLAEVARAHSRDMAENDFFAHVSPTTGDAVHRVREAGISFAYVGENIAVGDDVQEAHEGLMASPAHRQGILSRMATRVGVGVVIHQKVENGPELFYVTEVFSTPAPKVEPPPAPPPAPPPKALKKTKAKHGREGPRFATEKDAVRACQIVVARSASFDIAKAGGVQAGLRRAKADLRRQATAEGANTILLETFRKGGLMKVWGTLYRCPQKSGGQR